MFTGIVEEVGRVVAVERREGATRLTIEGQVVHEGARLGDSIAVNGVCLTVVAIDGARLAFEAVPETLRRTNLGALEAGSAVDLERPVSASRPMGGHYVQGHVDGTARVRSARPDGEALEVWFDAPAELARFVAPKGYVTIDGASLTVVEVDASGFSVTLVPHTQRGVVFGAPRAGYLANLEVDVMAKYVERIMAPRLEALEARLSALEEKG
ncbi:MAG: riboflavin synthase [Sandaracinaceae bacterium]|nr:riboflavin synthase [Sandaracinaceae bacterium]